MLNSDGVMNMRAFLFFFASFLVGICAWLGLRVVLLDYVHMPERAMWLAKSRMIDNYRYKDSDVIIIGSSRAMAINPERLQQQYNVNAINFSVGGATTPSTYFLIKRLLNNNSKIRKVYLEFAPINMSNKDTGLDASLGENFLRHVATKEEAEELDANLPGALDMYRKIHTFPFTKYVNMKDISLLEGVLIRWRTGKSDDGVAKKLIAQKGWFLYSGSISSDDQKNSSLEIKANEYYKMTDKYTETIPTVTGEYFSKTIRLLNERKVDYAFFFSPIPNVAKQYNNLAFGRTYNLFKNASSNVNDAVPVFPNKLFSDPSHVNSEGSIYFTSFFYDCIIHYQCDNYNAVSLF